MIEKTSTERMHAAAEALAAFQEATAERRRAQIIARTPDAEIDVTEDVVSIMDQITRSMEWGSGFFNDEDLVAFIRLADLLKIDISPDLRPPGFEGG